ncbi:MAG: DUF354 domain-containing protein [Ignavibacteria bacterium]|nr:DUF354 domain-containing protein [Ignavibacteria bacterium]
MIWFDLDNSPHVPIFRPIFSELEKRGIKFIVTARDFAQTKDLLDFWNIEYTLIGKHGGKSKFGKLRNLITRAFQLRNFIKNKDVKLAVSHGSRTQIIAAKLLKIPSLLMLDYEYTETKIFNLFATKLLIPEFIPDERLIGAGFKMKKVIRYGGFKEEIYLQSFIPDLNFRKSHDIPENKILVIIRPPALLGNYHDPKSEKLFVEAIKYFAKNENTFILVISRTKEDRTLIKNYIASGNFRFLEHAVDGLQLLYAADITLSGGGTMNRESALLGTPTYSIFTGKRPYLDEYLSDKGDLKFIDTVDDIKYICIDKKKLCNFTSTQNLSKRITDIICDQSKY